MSKKGKTKWPIAAAVLLALLPVAGAIGVLPPVVVAALTAAGQAVLGGPPVAAP